jgi:hypothetical protein
MRGGHSPRADGFSRRRVLDALVAARILVFDGEGHVAWIEAQGRLWPGPQTQGPQSPGIGVDPARVHLESTCDLRDCEQLNLVGVSVAEQLEDPVSDDVDEPQFELGRRRVIERRRSPVFRRAHVILSGERPPSWIGIACSGSYGVAASCVFLPHTVWLGRSIVKLLGCGDQPRRLTLVVCAHGTGTQQSGA